MGRPANPHRQTIISLRKAGWWPREIADSLGLSRNAVIGICNRAGLSDPNVDRGAAMVASAHVRRGEAHAFAKLTADDVIEIRGRYKPYSPSDGATALAREKGLSLEATRQAISGQTWAHVQ